MGLLLTLSAESYLKSFGPANAKQGLVFPDKLYGFLIPIITTTKASAKRRLGEEGGGEAAAKVYHPHKQFVKSWLVVESSLSFVVLVITHFFLTLLLSCLLLLLSILNHKQKTACAMHLANHKLQRQKINAIQYSGADGAEKEEKSTH